MPKVAIIGGGPSGLVAARYAVLQGLEPVIFEQYSELGGLWHPKTGSTWDGMHTNLSKFSCMFSDLAWDENAEMFPSRDAIYAYLCRYTEKFNLKKYFQFNTRVTNVKQNAEKWQITYEATKNSAEPILKQEAPPSSKVAKTEHFDFVIIASGIFSIPYIPKFKGLQNFTGEATHSSNYKNYKPFEKKNVVVIGSSFTATEIAADISTHATSVINILKTPHYILNRNLATNSLTSPEKLPVDLVFYKRSTRKSPEEITRKSEQDNANAHKYLSSLCKAQGTAAKELEIDPNSVTPTYVAISDDYVPAVQAGKIQVKKGSIDHFEANHIVLSDNTKIFADKVIFCTGYQFNLSYLDISLRKKLGYKPDDQLQPVLLYKSTFHPNIPGLAFAGCHRGPFWATIEEQAHWISLIFSNKIVLPNQKVMEKGIEEENTIRNLKPRPQFPHGDYVGMTDGIAKEIGCLPDFEKLKIENKILHDQLWAGPFLPTHFKLVGPQANPKALADQLEQVQKVLRPKREAKLPEAESATITSSSQKVKSNDSGISTNLTAYNMARCTLGAVIAGLGLYIGYKIATTKPNRQG